MNVVSIPVDLIEVGERLRAVDEDYAVVIAASMAVDGQRTPIEVRTPGANGLYRLIAGGHRFRAVQIASLAHVLALVMDVSDLQAKRLQIEENLFRHELNEMDRAAFLAEWRTVYLELEGAAKHGGRRGKQVRTDANLTVPRLERFTAIAADKLGLSEQTISRLAKRYRDIAPEVRRKISGTWLADNGAELDFLARLTPEVQRQVVALMAERGATSLKPLRDVVMGIHAPAPDPDQAQCDALLKLWRRTGTTAKRAFAAELAKDGPWTLEEA